jgi:hypothetical protein
MPGIVPTPYIVALVKRIESDQIDPDTGCAVVIDLPAVIIRVQGISQIGQVRGSSRQIMSESFVKRVETALHISTFDPSVFAPNDSVMLFPGVDADGAYTPGTGVAFWVDGIAIDARTSPWPTLTRMFGGTVEIKRVT